MWRKPPALKSGHQLPCTRNLNLSGFLSAPFAEVGRTSEKSINILIPCCRRRGSSRRQGERGVGGFPPHRTIHSPMFAAYEKWKTSPEAQAWAAATLKEGQGPVEAVQSAVKHMEKASKGFNLYEPPGGSAQYVPELAKKVGKAVGNTAVNLGIEHASSYAGPFAPFLRAGLYSAKDHLAGKKTYYGRGGWSRYNLKGVYNRYKYSKYRRPWRRRWRPYRRFRLRRRHRRRRRARRYRRDVSRAMRAASWMYS